MTKKELEKEVAGLKAKQRWMEQRLNELQPEPNEASDDDLFYILHRRGFPAYLAKLKERNALREARAKEKAA